MVGKRLPRKNFLRCPLFPNRELETAQRRKRVKHPSAWKHVSHPAIKAMVGSFTLAQSQDLGASCLPPFSAHFRNFAFVFGSSPGDVSYELDNN